MHIYSDQKQMETLIPFDFLWESVMQYTISVWILDTFKITTVVINMHDSVLHISCVCCLPNIVDC